MKIITVRQPWAWAIIHAGKDVENRTWSTSYRGPLVIHAAKTPPSEADIRRVIDITGRSGPHVWRLGAIQGVVDLVDVLPPGAATPSKWYTGYFGFVLARPRATSGIELVGRLGLRDCPTEIADRLMLEMMA